MAAERLTSTLTVGHLRGVVALIVGDCESGGMVERLGWHPPPGALLAIDTVVVGQPLRLASTSHESSGNEVVGRCCHAARSWRSATAGDDLACLNSPDYGMPITAAA